MRKVLVLSLVLLVVSLGTSIVSAQTPNIQVFFDQWLGQAHLSECPPDGPGVEEGWLYVVASNFNIWINGVEFAIDYPPELLWVFDQSTGGLISGITPSSYPGYDCTAPAYLCPGIGITYPIPLNGFSPVLLCRVWVEYDCHGCPRNNIPIDVVQNPSSGTLRATEWPGLAVFDAVGMRSLICPTVPTEETTWGNIKALYN